MVAHDPCRLDTCRVCFIEDLFLCAGVICTHAFGLVCLDEDDEDDEPGSPSLGSIVMWGFGGDSSVARRGHHHRFRWCFAAKMMDGSVMNCDLKIILPVLIMTCNCIRGGGEGGGKALQAVRRFRFLVFRTGRLLLCPVLLALYAVCCPSLLACVACLCLILSCIHLRFGVVASGMASCASLQRRSR